VGSHRPDCPLGPSPIAEHGDIQVAGTRLERIAAARAFAFDALGEMWDTAPTIEQCASFLLTTR
jgi:hypothetical protein